MKTKPDDPIMVAITGIVLAIACILAGMHISNETKRSHFEAPPPPPTDAENWQEVRKKMGLDR